MKPQITYEDFDKVDIRVGTVISVKKNKKAKKPSLVIEVAPYGAATLLADGHLNTNSETGVILVYGSEYAKGESYTDDAGTAAQDHRQANEPDFKSFTNKPIIMKDYYEVSGSDTARIGWVEVAGEEG